MGKIYQGEFQVPYYQSDARREMALPAILSVALQMSGEQSDLLERSDVWLYEHFHYVWIVTEYEISIQRLPRFAEKIRIETEAQNYNKFFCYRDFRFFDEKGDLILTIHSAWVLMDPDTRKAARVEDEIVAPYDSEKISRLERGHKFTKLENPEKRVYHVRYSDIDMNQHVNNSKYYDWAVDPLGFDFLTQHQPRKIFIKYNHEVRPGEEISSSYQLAGNKSYHVINDNDAQIEIEWSEHFSDEA
ncbi:MAG: acyl-[acyl-carrier-protein] thioesterase [Streptococcaceae bacterium]|jgi:medium-chain acyl-[acyl-carrier-protein] hydrolase|nr:acyl-[acyl-carrier-protein] thioesterase [Streptococcaceae bacterium]